jgi:hypothetical protein
MLVHEAALIQTLIDKVGPKRILDCGSGTRADRTIIQPHIAAAFDGYDTVLTDLRAAPGVLACDFTKPETLADLPRCDLVTCCSLLEHVENIAEAVQAVCSLADDWLLVSVPWKYPKHDCPIDNGWRPSHADLAAEIAVHGFEIVDQFASGPEQFGNVQDASASVVLARRKPKE